MQKLATLLLVGAAACGKSESSSSSKAPPAPKLDIAAVNALVPADLKTKLVFEARDIVEERGKRSTTTYTLAAPQAWEQEGKMFANLRPTSDANLGFFTSLRVGSNCDGRCEPKDWAQVSEQVNFAQLRDGKIVKDEATKTSHLMIVDKDDTTHVVYAWWSAGARHYYSCTATLDAPIKGAADAFAKACQAVSVKGRD